MTSARRGPTGASAGDCGGSLCLTATGAETCGGDGPTGASAGDCGGSLCPTATGAESDGPTGADEGPMRDRFFKISFTDHMLEHQRGRREES